MSVIVNCVVIIVIIAVIFIKFDFMVFNACCMTIVRKYTSHPIEYLINSPLKSAQIDESLINSKALAGNGQCCVELRITVILHVCINATPIRLHTLDRANATSTLQKHLQ